MCSYPHRAWPRTELDPGCALRWGKGQVDEHELDWGVSFLRQLAGLTSQSLGCLTYIWSLTTTLLGNTGELVFHKKPGYSL